jgi:hypothetical protein
LALMSSVDRRRSAVYADDKLKLPTEMSLDFV